MTTDKETPADGRPFERPVRPLKMDVDLAEAIRAYSEENARLRAFARDVMRAWPHGDLDGNDLQNCAVKYGLLTPETRTAPCGEDGSCKCTDYYDSDEWADGITCYRRAAWLWLNEGTKG